LRGKQLDSVTNYPFKNAIISYILSGDERALINVLYSLINNYPKKVLDNLMNLLGTHDTTRILTELCGEARPSDKDGRSTFTINNYDRAKKRLFLASVLQYTLPGVPCVYYGDEVGMQGCEDPFNRRCYPWGSEDESVKAHYKNLGELRKRSELGGGTVKVNYAGSGVIDFTRGESLRVVVNAGETVYLLDKEVTDLVSGEKKKEIGNCEFVVCEL
jgi:glycosidase